MARQALSADTFPLGLSYLHLLTGHEPYEVLLDSVYCPAALMHGLQQVWSPGEDDKENQYYVIQEVVRTCRLDHEDVQAAGGYDGAILAHTLYRYLVLFGPPKIQEWEIYEKSPAWNVIQTVLGFNAEPSPTRARARRSRHRSGSSSDSSTHHAHNSCGATREVQDARKAYEAHSQLWNWQHGSHPIMQQARQRLHDMGRGAARLLERMTHFDPSRRCNMHEALTSSLFTPLVDNSRSRSGSSSVGYGHLQLGSGSTSRSGSSSPRASPRSLPRSPRSANYEVRFMHYYREIDDGGAEVLPLV